MDHDFVEDSEVETPDEIPRIRDESYEEYLRRVASGREYDDDPLALTIRASQALGLDVPIAELAMKIVELAEDLSLLRESSPESLAAASIYIASHIFHKPHDLGYVAGLADVSERSIQRVYRAVFFKRYELIDEEWLYMVGSATLGQAAENLDHLLVSAFLYPYFPFLVSINQIRSHSHTNSELC